MYTPVASLDHALRGTRRFLEVFRGKPNLDHILRSYLDEIQKLEDATWEVLLIRSIEDSQGVLLDKIGVIVGRGRTGLTDHYYRIALRGQIAINKSDGTNMDLLKVAQLSAPGFDFVFTPSYPATITLEMVSAAFFGVAVLMRNLITAKAGGVRLLLVWSDQDAAHTLALGDSVAPSASLTSGLGDVLSLVGGGLTSVLEG